MKSAYFYITLCPTGEQCERSENLDLGNFDLTPVETCDGSLRPLAVYLIRRFLWHGPNPALAGTWLGRYLLKHL